jgi:hypothetical protein
MELKKITRFLFFIFILASCDSKTIEVKNNKIIYNGKFKGGEVLTKINTNLSSDNFPERTFNDSVFSLVKIINSAKDINKLRVNKPNIGYIWEEGNFESKIKKHKVCPLNLKNDGWYSITNLLINGEYWSVTFYMKNGECIDYKYELVTVSPI